VSSFKRRCQNEDCQVGVTKRPEQSVIATLRGGQWMDLRRVDPKRVKIADCPAAREQKRSVGKTRTVPRVQNWGGKGEGGLVREQQVRHSI